MNSIMNWSNSTVNLNRHNNVNSIALISSDYAGKPFSQIETEVTL